MTLLPVDSWRAVARPDLPPYKLNTVCAKPGSNETYNLEAHHIFRRSFGKDFREAWWVELEDGTIVPNRVALSRAAHGAITNNEAHIKWLGDSFHWYAAAKYGHEDGTEVDGWVYVGPLEPQPPKWAPETSREMDFHVLQSQAVIGTEVFDMHTHEKVGDLAVAEGETCPKCQRRVPHKRKKTSPTSKVFATRVPLDSVDDFEEMLDAAAEHMGIKEKPYHRANVITAGLVLVLQAPKDALLG